MAIYTGAGKGGFGGDRPPQPVAPPPQNIVSTPQTTLYGLPYVSPGDDQYASEVQANILRAQWNDWKQRFLPIQNQFLSSINDPSVEANAEQNALNDVNAAYNNAQNQTQNNLAGYGIHMSPEQQANYQRAQQVNKAAAQAGAINTTRLNKYDLNLALLGGGLSSASALGGIAPQQQGTP